MLHKIYRTVQEWMAQGSRFSKPQRVHALSFWNDDVLGAGALEVLVNAEGGSDSTGVEPGVPSINVVGAGGDAYSGSPRIGPVPTTSFVLQPGEGVVLKEAAHSLAVRFAPGEMVLSPEGAAVESRARTAVMAPGKVSSFRSALEADAHPKLQCGLSWSPHPIVKYGGGRRPRAFSLPAITRSLLETGADTGRVRSYDLIGDGQASGAYIVPPRTMFPAAALAGCRKVLHLRVRAVGGGTQAKEGGYIIITGGQVGGGSPTSPEMFRIGTSGLLSSNGAETQVEIDMGAADADICTGIGDTYTSTEYLNVGYQNVSGVYHVVSAVWRIEPGQSVPGVRKARHLFDSVTGVTQAINDVAGVWLPTWGRKFNISFGANTGTFTVRLFRGQTGAMASGSTDTVVAAGLTAAHYYYGDNGGMRDARVTVNCTGAGLFINLALETVAS